MADARLRISGAQRVKNGAIGDFAGQPDIFRVDHADMRAHQQPPPMRWRAGNMRDAGFAAGGRDSRQAALRRPTEPAAPPGRRRAEKSASRRNDECHRMSPTPAVPRWRRLRRAARRTMRDQLWRAGGARMSASPIRSERGSSSSASRGRDPRRTWMRAVRPPKSSSAASAMIASIPA